MRSPSLSILHLAVAIFIAVGAFTLIAVIIRANQRGSHGPHQSTQLRGIYQGVFAYANSNKGWYPGINSDGQTDELGIASRYRLMIESELFTPDYLISPYEQDPHIRAWNQEETFTEHHYSFALLQVPESGGRRGEWRQTMNMDAIILSDRNTGTADSPDSIFSGPAEEVWRGYALFNDSHTKFEDTPNFETRYDGFTNDNDMLFQSVGENDALLIDRDN